MFGRPLRCLALSLLANGWFGATPSFYLYVGAAERALDYYEEARPLVSDIALLWHPSFAPIRKLGRFKKVIRNQGLVDYWRERGRPEQRHPTTGDDFECN